MARSMAPFQGRVQCRVCEARITVAAQRTAAEAAEAAETRASIHCPICESTVSFDAPGDIDEPSIHVMGFEYEAESLKRKGSRPRQEREGD